MVHIGMIDLVFHEVINDIQRKRKLRQKNILPVHKTRRAVQEKTFALVLAEFFLTKRNGGG